MSNREEAVDTRRLTANEIFDAAVENAREEVKRSVRTLAFSGVAGGITMGLTGLGVASIRSLVGDGGWQDFISYLIYPVGFIAVIIGRAQLFTENTLYPVVLVLDKRSYLLATARLWAVVFASNIFGALLFAILVTKTSALRPDILSQLLKLGNEAAYGNPSHFFWSGVIGGWLIALVAWMVTASHWTIGQLAMVWLLTFVVGIGKFAHCVVTSTEILSVVVSGSMPLMNYLRWIIPATLGNIVGGVFIVSLLNYGQVRESI
ncbi:MAG TPA: formate/nitrite transporter family protein [Terriglobales bacterium]|nr:formate/nitrite transporter family protein [Terriglobales bacterium]